MKAAIIGAGALGAVYGVHLSDVIDVVYVVRSPRAPGSLRVERVRKDDEKERPATFVTEVTGDADIVLVAVGTEDLGSVEIPGEIPIVVLTPMLPHDLERMQARFGDRVYATLVNVVAYKRDDVFRFWLLPIPTRIDETRDVTVHALVEALDECGIPAKLELGIHERNPATTVCFIPIMMTLALAGSLAALADDEALLGLAREAAREGARLGTRIGATEPFFTLAPFLATPWAFRAFARLLPEEARFYAEEHFARKLVKQHAVMARDMVRLADEKRLPATALRTLADRLAML